MDRRQFISQGGKVAAVATGLGSTVLLAEAAEPGPIETAWMEFLRREHAINTGGPADVTDEEYEWWMTPAHEAHGQQPLTAREWAFYTLVCGFFRDSEAGMVRAAAALGPNCGFESAWGG